LAEILSASKLNYPADLAQLVQDFPQEPFYNAAQVTALLELNYAISIVGSSGMARGVLAGADLCRRDRRPSSARCDRAGKEDRGSAARR
jgi:hypothetical protein